MSSPGNYAIARFTALIAYTGLLVLLLFWTWQFGPADPSPSINIAAKLVLWLLICSGLLLVAPGVMRARRRSHQWLCFILLIYFVWTVQSLLSSTGGQLGQTVQKPGYLFDSILLALIVICFIASMLTVRWGNNSVP